MKLVIQHYRAWSDCTKMQAGLVLYRWQNLTTLGFGWIRVKIIVTKPDVGHET